MKDHRFYADAHVDRKKVRAAVRLEEFIQELPEMDSRRAARFCNQMMQYVCIYIKDLKNLQVKRQAISKLIQEMTYKKIDDKSETGPYAIHPKVKSLLKNIVHAKFCAEIFDNKSNI